MGQKSGNFTKEQKQRFLDAYPPSSGFEHHIRQLDRARGGIWQANARIIPYRLQTRDYARNMFRTTYPDAPEDRIKEMAGAQHERQVALRDLYHTVIIGKGALEGADNDQLEVLRRGVRGKLDNVKVLLLPGDGDYLPTPSSWPEDLAAQPDLIVTSSRKDGRAAHIHEGDTVLFGDMAKLLNTAIRDIGKMAIDGEIAEQTVTDYIS